MELTRPTVSRNNGRHMLRGFFYSFRADGDLHDVAADHFVRGPSINLFREGIPVGHNSVEVRADDGRLDGAQVEVLHAGTLASRKMLGGFSHEGAIKLRVNRESCLRDFTIR